MGMAVKLFKGGGSLIGYFDYFSQDVNVKEISLFLVLVEKSISFPYRSDGHIHINRMTQAYRNYVHLITFKTA